MSKFFKSKKPSVETKIVEIPEYKKVRRKLSDYLYSTIGTTGPTYRNQRIADFTPEEKEYFTRMRTLASRQGLTPSYQRAQAEVQKTLEGEYDPTTSLYYKALRDAAQYNLQKTFQRIADAAAGGGRYWAGARLKQQQEAATQMGNELNRILGQLALQERQNRLGVIPYAMSLGRIEEVLPAQRAGYLYDIGEIQRRLEQARLDELYRDWYFRNVEWPMRMAQLGLGMVQGEPIRIDTIVKPGRPSLFGRVAGPLATIAGYALGGPLGGMLGSALGSAVGSASSPAGSSLLGTSPGRLMSAYSTL